MNIMSRLKKVSLAAASAVMLGMGTVGQAAEPA